MIKKRYLLLIMLVLLFAVSAVSAEDFGNDENMHLNEDEIQGVDNGTFNALQEKINNAEEGSTITLENNYTYDDSFKDNYISIAKSITVDGGGFTIDAANALGIFNISASNVVLNNISFVNAVSYNGVGGAIYSDGALSVINCKFMDCIAPVSSIGDLMVINSSFEKNYNDWIGGAIWSKGTLTVQDSSFTENVAYYGCGGAIYSDGDLTVSGSNFIGNEAQDSDHQGNDGGAIWSTGTLLVQGSAFINNFANTCGAAIYGNEISLKDSSFINNTVTYRPVYALNLSIENCTFMPEITIDAPDLVKYYSGPERFNVNVYDFKGNGISGKSVIININGNEYERTTDENGMASVGVNLNSGMHYALVKCDDSTVNSTITVETTVSGENITKTFRNETQYYAGFLDTEGNPLANTPVTFNINGVLYTRTTDENGVAKMNINLNPGKYIITAKNPNSTELHSNLVTVLPNIVENHDLTKYYKNDSQYVIRLLDDEGNPAGAGETVEFNINGVFYKRTSDATGHVKMNINLIPGIYTITANYKGLMASNTITVKPVLESSDLSMKFRDGSKFEAKVLDGRGNPYAGQTVTFNINGVFYDRVTDDNGIARLNINLPSGKYIITSTYNGLNIANNIRIAPNPIYYTIGNNPLDYDYYVNEYNRFTWDWYYSPQHEAMVRTIYDIYGNSGMEIQDQYVHYGSKYYCWDQSTGLDYRLNKEGEVITVTNMMDYYVDYKEYDYNNNEIFYHNIRLPNYDAEITTEIDGYNVNVHQWRTPSYSEVDIRVIDKNGNMIDLYNYDTMIFNNGKWYGPYDQEANYYVSTYHKWHMAPNSRTTEVAVKIRTYM